MPRDPVIPIAVATPELCFINLQGKLPIQAIVTCSLTPKYQVAGLDGPCAPCLTGVGSPQMLS